MPPVSSGYLPWLRPYGSATEEAPTLYCGSSSRGLTGDDALWVLETCATIRHLWHPPSPRPVGHNGGQSGKNAGVRRGLCRALSSVHGIVMVPPELSSCEYFKRHGWSTIRL